MVCVEQITHSTRSVPISVWLRNQLTNYMNHKNNRLGALFIAFGFVLLVSPLLASGDRLLEVSAGFSGTWRLAASGTTDA